MFQICFGNVIFRQFVAGDELALGNIADNVLNYFRSLADITPDNTTSLCSFHLFEELQLIKCIHHRDIL